jgi:heptosyltransferase-1
MPSVLLIRLGALGDVVHAMPVVSALVEAWPGVRVGWAVQAPYAELVSRVRGVTSVHVVRSRVDIGATRAMRRAAYDVCLDLQGLMKSAAYARASGARRVIGFAKDLAREPLAALAYGETGGVPGRHVVEQNLSLLQRLGIAPAGVPPIDIDVPPSVVVKSARVLLGDPEARYVLVNPGAAWPNKRWPVERFASLADDVYRAHGLRTLVAWGPGEASLAAAVATASSDGAAVMAPEAGILDLLALAQAAEVVVAGDTGPLHLAAAIGTPVVGLFGPTPPARNGPWHPDDLVVSRHDACQCVFERRCTSGQWCLGGIPVEDVAAAVTERLRRQRPQPPGAGPQEA